MQTVQNPNTTPARVGMLYGSIFEQSIDSRNVVQTTAIPAGRFCVKGTAADQVILPTATGQINGSGRGFAVLQTAKGDNDTANEYAIGDPIALLRAGLIWADAEEAMAVDANVFVRFDTAGSGVSGAALGKVRTDADTARAVQLFGARVYKACTAAGPVLIELVGLTDFS